jgi:hypothetical protein
MFCFVTLPKSQSRLLAVAVCQVARYSISPSPVHRAAMALVMCELASGREAVLMTTVHAFTATNARIA